MRLPPSYSAGWNWVRFNEIAERLAIFATHKGRNEKYVRPGGEKMMSKSSDNHRIRTCNRQMDRPHLAEVTTEVRQMLGVLDGDMSRQDLQNLLGLKDKEHFRQAYLLPAIRANPIGMALSDRPRNSKQRYRLTRKERSVRGGSRS